MILEIPSSIEIQSETAINITSPAVQEAIVESIASALGIGKEYIRLDYVQTTITNTGNSISHDQSVIVHGAPGRRLLTLSMHPVHSISIHQVPNPQGNKNGGEIYGIYCIGRGSN